MGYMKHEGLIMTTWHDESSARIEAFRSAMPEEYRHLLVGPVPVVNGYDSWAFMPDGSKEGWTHSDEAQALRVALATLCEQAPGYVNWAFVRFGGDDELRRIITSDDGADLIGG